MSITNPNYPDYSAEVFTDSRYGNDVTISIDMDPDVEIEVGEGFALLNLDEAERLGKYLLAIVAKKRAQS